MRRAIALLLVLALPLSAGHAAERVFRLGSLAPSIDSLEVTRSTTLPELAKLGFHEGDNLIVEERTGDAAALPELAHAIVAGRPDAILAIGGEAINAAREATSTIPIVIFGADPVRMGLASSLAHPSGNVTGVVILAVELDGKRVDLLHEAVPAMRRIAGLFVPSAPGRQTSETQMRNVAATIGLEFLPFDASGPQEYPRALTAMREAGVQGVAFMANPFLYRDRAQLAELAWRSALRASANGRRWHGPVVSSAMVQTGPNCASASRIMWREYFAAPRPPSCRSSSRPITS